MKRPEIKDKSVLEYVNYLEEKLSKFENNPYSSSYLAIYNQINDWNNQLKIRTEKKTVEGKEYNVEMGKIDLFSDKDDKSFDRAWKYFLDAPVILESLSKLRKMMSPEEKEEVDKNLPLAEKVLRNGK